MIDKNKVPKDLFGTESEVIDKLSKEFKLSIEDAKVALDRFVHLGIVLKESSMSVPGMPSDSVYSYNKNFDWDAYESSHYVKYRYMVIGIYQRVKLSDVHRFNVIVEWDRCDLNSLIKEIKKSLNLRPSHGITDCDISISDLIEIGYPTEKE